MSKLEELIAELCPDGVEYKTLGEIATDIYRGSGITRDQVTPEGIPCVRYGEIYTTYGVWFDKCMSHTNESLIKNKKYFGYGDILFAITGESVEEIAKSSAYVGHETCLAGGDTVILKHTQNPKYMTYVLSTVAAQQQKSKGKVKSKVVHSSVPAISAIRIPVPPLPVQREIVRILDNFTELTAGLTAELTARKKQYEYYRDAMLNNCAGAVETRFGDMFEFQNGFAFKSGLFKDSGWPILRITNIQDQHINTNGLAYFDTADYNEDLSSFIVSPGDIVVAMSGATTGKIGVNSTDQKYYLNQRVGRFSPKSDVILNRYLYHLLLQKSGELYAMSGGGAQPNLSSERLKQLTAMLPPIYEQKRIAAILDRFDALCNDLTSGLPAEIAARQKQYEYYRDKLLTFKELA